MKNSLETRLLAPIEAEISARIAWLIQLRWIAVVGALMAVTAADILLPGVLPIVCLVGIIAFLGVCNVVFYVYSHVLHTMTDEDKQLRCSVQFTYVQIAVDLICLTFLLHCAGGAENLFWMFYVLHCIVASFLLSRTAAYVYAGAATILFGGLILLEYLGVIPHFNLVGVVGPDRYRRESYLIMTFVAFVTLLFFSAVMATSIVARLRQRGRELLEMTEQAQIRALELAELNRRLEEMSEARERFVRLVTHELRSPVAAIQSYLRLILGGYVPPEKQNEILVRAEKRAEEQLNQINDLLMLSQLQEHRSRVSEVDLRELLDKALEALRGSAEEKKIALHVHADPHTTPIMADRDQIYHVWLNLVSNAIKYTPAGGEVEITLTNRPESVMGAVKDTGIGIAPKDQQRIFEEYYRTEEAKCMEQHGTGLGLAIVKRIIEGYGGRIWVNSAQGEGSKFNFVLPRDGSTSRQSLPGDGETPVVWRGGENRREERG